MDHVEKFMSAWNLILEAQEIMSKVFEDLSKEEQTDNEIIKSADDKMTPQIKYYRKKKNEILQKQKDKYNSEEEKKKKKEYYEKNKDKLKQKSKERYKSKKSEIKSEIKSDVNIYQDGDKTCVEGNTS